MQAVVTKILSGIFTMNYAYRIEHIKLLDKKCFIESDQRRDLLAVRVEWLRDFEAFFTLSPEEKQSYSRIKKWAIENHPELML